MKVIKIICCGVCPHNKIKILKFGGWYDYCFLLCKKIGPNKIDDKCPLNDYKK